MKYEIEQCFDVLDVIIVIIDVSEEVIFVNRKACEVLGYKREDIVGKNWFEHFIAEEAKGEVREVFQLLATGKEEGAEYFKNHVLMAQGEKRLFAWHNGVLRDKAGNIVAIVSSGKDIAEYIQRQEIDSRRLKYEEVIASVTSRFVYASDLDTAINSSLEEIGRLTGADRVYVFLLNEGRRTADNTHEWCAEGVCPQIDNLKGVAAEDFSLWQSEFRRGRAVHVKEVAKLPAEMEAEKRMLEGQDIKSVLLLPLNVDGQLSGFVGFDNVHLPHEWSQDDIRILMIFSGLLGNVFVQDRTKRLLARKDCFIMQVMDNSPLPMLVINPDTSIKFVNVAFSELTGFSLKEILDKKAPYPWWEGRVASDFFSAFQKGQQTDREAAFRKKNGGLFWISVNAREVMKDNKLSYYLVAWLDITERKAAERALQEHYKEERALRQSLEKEIGKRAELYRALVHELKTPLTPIKASSDLLMNNLTEEPWRGIAQTLNRGATILDRRISELLDIAKGEMGQLRLNSQPIDIKLLLHDVGEKMLAVFLRDGQTLTVEVPPSLPQIYADRGRLWQVTLNLLVNANKFVQKGGEVILRAREEKEFLVVSVEDNGPGIEKEEKVLLFSPYYRAGQEKHRFAGLGLGLALCKEIVELHGGRIWVESEKGRGCNFSFSLPIGVFSKKADRKD